ncbi:MAG: hypothetical protein LBN32_00920 [Helicobacteraceae bacterium]|jgi:hypothetical protein|nr:hypothetical protein [Helicobacteraceae bacterium]
MAGQIFAFDDFRVFIRHEIGEMQRLLEDQRKITVMFFEHGESERVLNVLIESLRTSDVVFYRMDYFFVVMPLTDKEGAMHVARNLEDFFGEDVRDVNATWPEDGKTENELLSNFAQYIRTKCGLDMWNLIG